MVVDQPQQCVSDLIRSGEATGVGVAVTVTVVAACGALALALHPTTKHMPMSGATRSLFTLASAAGHRGGGVAVKLSTCIHQSLRR